MSNEQDDESIKKIPVRDLKIEPESEDLLDSPAMKPYLNLMMAMMQGKDTGPAIEELTALALEKRYTWRVASALKWAFGDLETMNVEADRRTLSREDQQRVRDLLQHRPLQFCLFLSALVGEKQMEALMISAIRHARQVAAQSDK
jgi:hypothetical protein